MLVEEEEKKKKKKNNQYSKGSTQIYFRMKIWATPEFRKKSVRAST